MMDEISLISSSSMPLDFSFQKRPEGKNQGIPLYEHWVTSSNITSVAGLFRDYEDYGLQREERTDISVSQTTKKLAQALEYNSSIEEFTLNMKAIEDAIDSETFLIKFLQKNSSLKSLHIRIPAECTSTKMFSDDIICPELKELTIWVAASTPCGQLSNRFPRKGGGITRFRNPYRTIGLRQDALVSGGKICKTPKKQLDMKHVAKFISNQPRLKSLRIQTSTLSIDQWMALLAGISANHSITHLECRRLESTFKDDYFPMDSLLHHPSIERIDFIGCPSMQGWYHLAGHQSELKQISYSSSPATTDQIHQLSNLLSSAYSFMTHLEMSHTNLSGEKTAMIAEMLKHNTSLQDLTLSSCKLTSEDCLVLTRGLYCNSTLTRLSLNDNFLFKHSCEQAYRGFQELLLMPTCNIQHLNLSDNDINPAINGGPCADLFKGLSGNSKLKELNLSNRVTAFADTIPSTFWSDMGMNQLKASEALGMALGSCQLTELTLNYLHIENTNIAKFLAPALANNYRIERLGLKRTGIGDEAMNALSKSLMNNSTLQYLDISLNCHITLEAYKNFAQCLGTLSQLHTLWFHCNHNDELHVRTIAPALKTQCNLRNISQEGSMESQYRLLLLANRNGRHLLYNPERVSDNLWPLILSRLSNNPQLLNLFLREKADFIASTMHRLPLGSTDTVQQQKGHKRKREFCFP